MQSDEVIWSVIGKSFCSFKATIAEHKFCRNGYNLTGECKRAYCPLANSRYATIREKHGLLFLFVKTIERAHSPANLWERIKLPRNYSEALEKVDEVLAYWPKLYVNKCKQRVTRIHQVLIRSRKMRTSMARELVPINTKIERREKTREAKAHVAAQLENSIRNELIERLKNKTYGEMYNVQESAFNQVMLNEGQKDVNKEMEQIKPKKKKSKEVEEDKFVDADELEEEDEEIYESDSDLEEKDIEDLGEYVTESDEDEYASNDDVVYSDSDFDESDEDDENSDKDDNEEEDKPSSSKRPLPKKKVTPLPKKKRISGRPELNIEYEDENERLTH